MLLLRSSDFWTKYLERFSNQDLIFICNGNIQVKTHKTIFASISNLMKEIVLANGQDVVYISLPDVKDKHLHNLVNFLYEGSAKLNVDELVSFKELLTLLSIKISNADIQMINKLPVKSEAVSFNQMLNTLPSATPDLISMHNAYTVTNTQLQPNVPGIVDVKVKQEFVTQGGGNFLNENENVPPSNSKPSLTDDDIIRNNMNVLQQALLVPAHTIVPNGVISTYTSVVNSTVPCLQTLTVGNDSAHDKSDPLETRSQTAISRKTKRLRKSPLKPNKMDDDDDDVIFINNEDPVIDLDPLSPAGLGYTCSYCNITYSTASYYEKHSKVCKKKIRASKVYPFACTVCKSSFFKRFQLVSHMQIHLGERPHKCELCDAKFTTLPALKNHIFVHTGERSYKCKFCEKTFRQRTYLRNHERVHTGDKPYMCKVCGLQFTRCERLKSHFRIHTGERAYKCNYCNQSFINSSQLSRHKKDHITPEGLVIL